MASCSKCHEPLVTPASTARHSAWCTKCFIDQLHVKFFQAFKTASQPGPERLSRPAPTTLMIHFENDLNSVVMLHLVRHYLDLHQTRSTEKWKRPVAFDTVQVVWIDPGSALSGAEHNIRIPDPLSVGNLVHRFGFAFVPLSLDLLFASPPAHPSGSHSRCFVDLSDPNLPLLTVDHPEDDCPTAHPLQTDDGAHESLTPTPAESDLEKMMRPLTKTSRRSMMEILSNVALLDFCKRPVPDSPSPSAPHHPVKTNNKVLIKSTSSTQLAIDTLLHVSLGNGFCLDQLVGPSSLIDDVLICRPIYQILDVELAQYAKFMNLLDDYHQLSRPQHSESDDPSLPSNGKKIENIPELISGFIHKLEESYPLTSPVINQTVSKLGKNKPAPTSRASTTGDPAAPGRPRTDCRICHRALDSHAHHWKRSITLGAHEAAGGAQEPRTAEAQETLSPQLCFGCLGTLNDHLYAARNPSSPALWTPLPQYCSPAPAPASNQPDLLHSVLDEFLLKD